MQIKFEKEKDLTNLTTFHIPVKCRLYAEFSNADQLQSISFTKEFADNPVYILGGGSNTLFKGDFDGLVIKPNIKGLKIYQKDEETVFLIAGASEKWTDVVDRALSEGLSGIENLAGIPGSAGAAPVQNIGAYGMEVAEVIHKVECFDLITRQTVTLTPEECHFGYRDSIFKNTGKGRYVVLRVSLKLKKSTVPTHLEYGPLKDLAERMGRQLSITDVAAEIIKIRNSKLPDPDKIGNAGSFFKNPIVRIYFYKEVMSSLCDNIPYYETEDPYYVKIPAGWLIEHAGLKGFCIGGAEVYPKQCLVIANTGNAKAEDVVNLADHVIREVLKKFGVSLEPEVCFVDSSIKITILGTGTSKGIPEVGCYCPVCRSDSPRDKRTRCSALVETQGVKLLIDVSPDFRQQALAAGITKLDGALITHEHYDHVGGFDDLRPFCTNGKFPVYLKKNVNEDLHRRLDYCFRDHAYPGVPSFEMHEIDDVPFLVKGVKIIPISVMHGKLPILGYRIGKFAYVTDAKTIPDEEKEKLQDLEVLVLNCLRYKDHFAHLTYEEALKIIDELKPKRTYLTHFCHEIGKHCELEKKLPENVFPAYDGMVIRVD